MKKIPTLFKREFENHRVVKVLDKVTEGMEWVFRGEGIATEKLDGSCCAIIGGELYKRYDAKRGKKPPEGAIPCCDPDPVTGHWPHWVKCCADNPADKWFFKAREKTIGEGDGTYEAVGKHFNGNPYCYEYDFLEKHGLRHIEYNFKSYDRIRHFLEVNNIEGLVFWKDNEPMCKIKRSDFGFEWPVI